MYVDKVINTLLDAGNKSQEATPITTHYPSVDEPYLTFSCGFNYYYYNFGSPLSVPATQTSDKPASVALIQQMRTEYGYGIMDCKWALGEADNDMAKAVKLLRSR
jgi:hypothetical protein